MRFPKTSLLASLILAISVADPSRSQTESAPPANETEIFAALVVHLAENAQTIQSGRYTDGREMGPICDQFGYNVCESEAFLGIHDTGESWLAKSLLKTDGRVLIDVRGPTERAWADLGRASVETIVYGVDGYDPLSISELDRAAFAETVSEALGGKTRPVAVICSLGVRSRAAAMALREAGFTDVVNVADGVLGNAAGDGYAAVLGIPVDMPQ
ncbi:rhodanese-like domain-containing protein [Roseovarius aestuariivivens]|uniref:rhodanese-like domain-containing protein n=1 Tax=Roseovarius aestuariivivens TaxID=1888910 RepID=UPI0014368474|nr:rhodanese-like domain-containing protein [Roseovarius aestuariivivens]